MASERYIRTVTEVDDINQKVVLKLTSCNQCPLSHIDTLNCIATCRVFSSKKGKTVINDFVLDFDDGTGAIYEHIDIPSWCGLARNEVELGFDIKTYTVVNNRVLTKEGVVGNDVKVVDGEKVFHDRFGEWRGTDYHYRYNDGPVTDYLPALVSANVGRTIGEAMYESAYEEYESRTFTPSPKKTKYQVCSVCGEEDETVNRDEHYGMCDTCWEQHKDNKDACSLAYVNNFRLKRGKSTKKDEIDSSIAMTLI